ncbi:MAG: sigma-70 family RNA polymerase sigma factor [Candidatus Promineifilaceae bacterium]|nr:sigma-70 family RNA polymerase sigma factor [Candidatus Promineifilaceae bacterium]
MIHDSDPALLQACRAGDSRAWKRVLEKYERLIYSIPLSYGLTEADAADILQLTFTIFIEQMDDLDEDSNLKAWLATVARRHTWRLLERTNRERVHGPDDLSERMYLLPDERGERALRRWEAVHWLQQGMDVLDERCRTLLRALYFAPEKLSYEEVAKEMDIAVGSVGPTRARCLERLKTILQEIDK